MLTWPLRQGRCVDGAPTLRIPSCAGECPCPLTSANTRLTDPRETSAPCPFGVNTRNRDTERDTRRLDTASRLHTRQQERCVARPGRRRPCRGAERRDITAPYRASRTGATGAVGTAAGSSTPGCTA